MKTIKKYKWINLFYLFSIIWSIDFIITIIALNISSNRLNLEEANILSNYLFSFGFFGYMLNFIFCIIIIFLFSFLICKLINRLKVELHKKIMWYLVIIIFILIEGLVIINNI
jgi:hypothetical protein